MTLRPHKRNVRGDVDALRPYVASRSKTGGYTAVTGSGRNNLLGGHVGGFEIGVYTLISDNGQVGLNSEVTAGTDWRFWAGNATRASAPFRVDSDGNLVASSATITGTITATAGAIGGWTINSDNLAKNNATLHSDGYLELGSGTDIVRLDAQDATYRIWVGHSTAGSAPFRVTKGGAFTATNANITGTIDANAGHIGTLDVDGVVTVGTGSPVIQIDGPNKRIQSSNFTSGLKGMRINADGTAELHDVTIRGELRASIFVKEEIHAAGGTFMVLEAGVLENEVTTI
jgi:hypothetical protein